MPPERTNLVLTSYVPDGERDVLVLDSLYVEAYVQIRAKPFSADAEK